MDARTYFLMLHEGAHTKGKSRRVFSVPTPEQWRTVVPGHNSIAWCVWHIARGEDWAVSVIRGDEQLLVRDGWEHRLGVARRDFGMGMTAQEAADLSASIDLDALRGYYDAIYTETRRFVHSIDFDALTERMGDADRRRALELMGPGGEPMRGHVERWATKLDYLNVMALMDVYYHLDEADHIVRLLAPERVIEVLNVPTARQTAAVRST